MSNYNHDAVLDKITKLTERVNTSDFHANYEDDKDLTVSQNSDSNNEVWQRISTLLGWNWWDVGIERPKYNFRTSKTKKKTRKKKSRQ